MRRYRPLGGGRGRGGRGVQVPAEPSRQLDIEGVEVDVADLLEQLGGAGVGQGVRQMIAPRLVLGQQSAELREGVCPSAGLVFAATFRATHCGNGRRRLPRWLTSPSPDHYSPAA